MREREGNTNEKDKAEKQHYGLERQLREEERNEPRGVRKVKKKE